MLTDEERERLKAEEIFRDEIRRQLEANREPTSRRAKLIRSLNTPFVLWALSSVLVGTFGWTFSKFEASRTTQLANHQTERTLDTEISCRLQEAISTLDSLEGKVRGGEWSFSEGYIYNQAIATTSGENSAIFPEYASRSCPSLMIELRSLVSPAERTQIDQSLKAFRAFEVTGNGDTGYSFGSDKRSEREIEQALSEIDKAKAIINLQIMGSRWK